MRLKWFKVVICTLWMLWKKLFRKLWRNIRNLMLINIMVSLDINRKSLATTIWTQWAKKEEIQYLYQAKRVVKMALSGHICSIRPSLKLFQKTRSPLLVVMDQNQEYPKYRQVQMLSHNYLQVQFWKLYQKL